MKNYMLFGDRDERMFRKMGFFDDQSGIIKRYRREQEHWDTHLQNTRKFAIGAMRGKTGGTAAVLGSGWLLDVPIDELSRSFGKVCLFDIRHPAEVKERAKTLGNVELHVCDISGYARPVHQYARQYRNRTDRPPVSDIQPQAGPDIAAFDFVFSCNILNQLDILLIDYLLRFFELSNDETIAFRSNIQHHHISLLPGNRSCMVADYEEVLYAPDGRELSRKESVYHPIVQRQDARRWTWEFDTQMTYYPEKKTFFRVLGVEI